MFHMNFYMNVILFTECMNFRSVLDPVRDNVSICWYFNMDYCVIINCFIYFRSVPDPVRDNVSICWYSTVLHGAILRPVRQRGCHLNMESLPSISR